MTWWRADPPARSPLGLLPLLLLLVAPPLLPTAAAPAAPVMRICGTQLADQLAEVCRGRGYNDPAVAPPPPAPAPGSGAAAGVVGVAEQCCRRGCTRRTLQQYCSPADPRRSSGPGGTASYRPAPSAATVGDESALPPVRALSAPPSPPPQKRPGGSRSGEGGGGLRRGKAAATMAAPAPTVASFRLGVVRSYFNNFVLPPGVVAAPGPSATTIDWPPATTPATAPPTTDAVDT